VLLDAPDKVLENGVVAFETALWFWMTAHPPEPSPHDVMTGGWVPDSSDVSSGRLAGFGMVTNIVNGGIECGVPTPQSVTNRVEYFEEYTSYFGVSDGGNLYCSNTLPY